MVIGGRDEAAAPSGRAARTGAIALAVSLVALTFALGYVDGTGLFAPENWVDAGAIPMFATSPAWATVVYLPLLIGGSAFVWHRIARHLSPGAPARWALWAAWSSVILAAFTAKFLYTLVLLAVAGPHALTLVPAAGAVLAQCGLSAAKHALLGLFAAGPTALAFRLSTRRERGPAGTVPAGTVPAGTVPAGTVAPGTDAAPPGPATTAAGAPPRLWSPVWFLIGAVIATNATGSTSAWMEGPSRRIILPVGGLVGAYAITAAIWARFSQRLTRPGPDLPPAIAGHLALYATTVGAAALGFLVPWAIDGVLHGFGGGLFPVVGALAHLGAGALAGLITGAAGWCGRLVRDRTSRQHQPAGRLLRPVTASGWRGYAAYGLLVAGALGLDLLPPPTTAAAHAVPLAASPDGGGLLALTVRRDKNPVIADPVIADSAGRQVLLRGVNVNQLIDYGQPDPAKPTVRPLTDDDYALMAAEYGFDVQRLGLSWSALEPVRGEFDRAYLARVRTAVDQAARHGIYTVLDMHQDTYSRYVTATAGTQCRPGAEPEFGNDGAPRWATLTGGAKGCGFMGRDLSPNVSQAFTNLYSDTDGIGAEFARAWGVLAGEFASDTAVAGYDLLNEPGPGNAPGVTSSVLLGRLYQQAISSIRAEESLVLSGFHHLVFFEPSILWSGLGFDASPPVGFSTDPALVFSPHLYSESITMDQGLGVTLTTIEHGYTMARRAADAYSVPLWSGEWGWFGDITAVRDRYHRFLNQQNQNRLGSAVWVWKKACGDPQTGATDASSGGIRPVSCPAGTDLPGPGFLTPALAQAYPRAAPGRLTTLSSSPTTVDMRLAGTGTGTLDVWIPGPATPSTSATGLTGLTVSPQPGGGWRLSAHASGAYTLSLH